MNDGAGGAIGAWPGGRRVFGGPLPGRGGRMIGVLGLGRVK